MNEHRVKVSSDNKHTRGWPKRLILVILFFSCNLICYMDRLNIAVTAPVIMKELGWDAAVMGIILSSFFSASHAHTPWRR